MPNAANSSSKMKTEVIGNLDKSHFQEGFRKKPGKTGLRVIRRKEIRDRECRYCFRGFCCSWCKEWSGSRWRNGLGKIPYFKMADIMVIRMIQ